MADENKCQYARRILLFFPELPIFVLKSLTCVYVKRILYTEDKTKSGHKDRSQRAETAKLKALRKKDSMRSTKTATKEVTVLAVYKFRDVARICFEVLASDETTKYNTCFNGDAQHASCNCPGHDEFHKVCYHITGLKARAQAYFESRQPQQAEEVEEDAPDLAKAEAHIATLKEQFQARQRAAIQPVQQEDWKETSQFGGQDHKMERAPSGRMVPMR